MKVTGNIPRAVLSSRICKLNWNTEKALTTKNREMEIKMANLNFNKVILGGRITADLELKQTQSGVSVVSGSIAVNRKYKDSNNQVQTDFFNFTAWRGTAEFISKFFKKGSSIIIVGSIQNRTWTDQQGQKRYATDIVADEAYFVDSKSESSADETYIPEAYAAPAANFEDMKTDEDLPF